MTTQTLPFYDRVESALHDQTLQTALGRATTRFDSSDAFSPRSSRTNNDVAAELHKKLQTFFDPFLSRRLDPDFHIIDIQYCLELDFSSVLVLDYRGGIFLAQQFIKSPDRLGLSSVRYASQNEYLFQN